MDWVQFFKVLSFNDIIHHFKFKSIGPMKMYYKCHLQISTASKQLKIISNTTVGDALRWIIIVITYQDLTKYNILYDTFNSSF